MKKIIWSIDAFQSDVSLQKSSIDFLRSLSRKTGCKVEPVYLLSPDQLNLSVEFTQPWIAHYQPAAEKAMDHLLKNVDIPGLIQPRVLVQKAPSLRGGVKTLTNYAASTGADLIAVGTHAKRGMTRMFVGSFTESLLLVAKVPVLTISPQTKIQSGLEHIVFATDLSDASREAFKRILRLAKAMGSRLTLYHHVPHPIEPIFQSGVYLMGGGWVPVSTYLHEETTQQRKQLEVLAARARKAGIATDIALDNGPTSVVDGLLATATGNKAAMIALAAQSGPIAAALAGSVTRQVVRSAECPVWVIHPEVTKKRRKNVTLL